MIFCNLHCIHVFKAQRCTRSRFHNLMESSQFIKLLYVYYDRHMTLSSMHLQAARFGRALAFPAVMVSANWRALYTCMV